MSGADSINRSPEVRGPGVLSAILRPGSDQNTSCPDLDDSASSQSGSSQTELKFQLVRARNEMKL